MIYLLTDWLIDLPRLNKHKLVEVPQTMNNREKTKTYFPILKGQADRVYGRGARWHSTKYYTAISRKVVGKDVHATIPKGNMGYDRYTVLDDCSCRTYFCCFPLALANTFSWPFVPILSNFSEEQWTQNHPQCLSGLSRALFPTTFLEKAVYGETPTRGLTP